MNISRFIRFDDIDMNSNLYIYCRNNPLICFDFSGNFSTMQSAVTVAITGILSAIAIGSYFAAMTFNYIPPDAFIGGPDAGVLGYQLSGSVSSALLKKCIVTQSPLCYAFVVATSFYAILSGVDIVHPFSTDELWIYSYIGLGVGFFENMSYKDVPSGVSLSGYIGLIWNLKDSDKYAGNFWCTSFGLIPGHEALLGLLSVYGKVGPGLTLCSSYDPVEKTYGPYMVIYAEGISSSASNLPGSYVVSSSLSRYFFSGRIEKPEILNLAPNFSNLSLNWRKVIERII